MLGETGHLRCLVCRCSSAGTLFLSTVFSSSVGRTRAPMFSPLPSRLTMPAGNVSRVGAGMAGMAALTVLTVLTMFSLSPAANAQTTPGIVPPAGTIVSKDIVIAIGIPATSVPSNVTGFRVDMLCTDSPATFDGTWTARATYTGTGQSVAVPTPFTDKTQCTFRLTVLGTGARPLVLAVNSVDAANAGFRYLDVVDGVTVDPQTVVAIGPLLIRDMKTLRFGAGPPPPTTTLAPATTTTTVAPVTTTTPPPTTTNAPTTVAATLPPPPPTTASPTTAPRVSVVRVVRVCTKRVKGKCVKTALVRRRARPAT